MPNPGHPPQRHEVPGARTLVLPQQEVTPAPKSLCCGLGDGSSLPKPPVHKKNGQWAPAACLKDVRSGGGSVQPRIPLNTNGEQEGRREDHPLSLTNDRQSKGPGQETQRGTKRLERPYQCPARGPREGRAPKGSGRG